MQNEESQSYVDRFKEWLRTPAATSQGGQFTAPQAPAPDAPKPPLYDTSPTALQRLMGALGGKIADIKENPGAFGSGNRIENGRIVAAPPQTFDQAFPPAPSGTGARVRPAAVPASPVAVPTARPVAPRGAFQPTPEQAMAGSALSAPGWEESMYSGLEGTPGYEAALKATVGDMSATPTPADTVTAAAPAVPRKSLMEMYQELIGKVPSNVAPTDTPLTDQQKAKLRLDFFLNMLSNSMKPGAYALGALGDAGKTTSAEFTALQDKNTAASDKRVQQQREDAFRAMGLLDKDQDNVRADARDEREGKRWDALDRRETKRLEAADTRSNRELKLREDELRARGQEVTGHVVLGNGNIGLITRGGIQDSKVKAKPAASETSEAERSYKFFQRIMPGETPQQTMDRVMGLRRENRGEYSNDEIMRDATKIKASGDPRPTREIADELKGVRDALNGGSAAPARGSLSRKDARYTEALKDPRVGGDKAKLDAALKARGWTVTD